MRAIFISLSCFVALFFLQECTASAGQSHYRARRSTTTNFDDHVRRWVERKGREVGRKVSWWDSYGKHQHLKERPQYHRFQISARTGPMTYNLQTLRETDKPQQVYSKWFCNHQTKQPITTVISRELQKRATFKWMQENGLKIGVELSMKATIPGVMDIGASFSTELDFRGSNTEVKTETETFKIQYEITIDPQTAVRADWIITEREVEVPYDLDVYIEGYTAVWFDQKTDGHWLWFYPVHLMSDNKFQRYGSGISYETTGIFNGARGIDSVIEAREFPLDPKLAGQCGGSSMGAGYYDTLTPTKITRVRMPLPSEVKHGEDDQ